MEDLLGFDRNYQKDLISRLDKLGWSFSIDESFHFQKYDEKYHDHIASYLELEFGLSNGVATLIWIEID